MNAILRSHFIDPEALRSDDFSGFFEKRREALLKLVEEAMGKTIERGFKQDEDAEGLNDDAFVDAEA